MARLSIGGIEMNLVDQGRGRPLLLVHGFPLDHTMWQGQADPLSRNYRVIVPDLRGFGASGVSEGPVSMERLADDLAALLDALQIEEPVALCGLSMGGYVAWQFWRRHASRLNRLILCDTRASADSEEAARAREETARRVLREGTAWLAEAMIPRLFAEQTLSQRPELVEATRQVICRADPRGVAAALRGMAARPDVTGWLPSIRLPTLVICGQHDAISTAAEMRDWASRIPVARFVEVPSAGHMAPLEQPAAVNAAIREFLSDA